MNRPARDRRTFKSVLASLGLVFGAVVLSVCPGIFMLGVLIIQEMALPALGSGVSIVILLGLIPLGIGLALTGGPAFVALLLLTSSAIAGRLPQMLGLALLFMVLGYGGAYFSGLIETASQESASLAEAASQEKWLRERAEEGDLAAHLDLGHWHLERAKAEGRLQKGGNSESECIQAIDWFEEAAYRGSAESQYQLGVTYDHCSPVGVNVPTFAWFQIAAGNPGATDEVLRKIDGHYRLNSYRGNSPDMPIDDILATQRVVDQVQALFADPEPAPDQRRAAIEQLLAPLIQNALNEKILWRSRYVSSPVKELSRRPGVDILSTRETEASGIAGERAELFGVVTLPLESIHDHIPVLGDPTSGTAVGIVLPATNPAGLLTGWQLYFLPPEFLQLDSYSPHMVIHIPNLSQPKESRPDRYWYRATSGEWKKVPADSENHWNQVWADRMESDAVPAGDPLTP